MLPLIINVARVLITVDSGLHGVPVVFWALSQRKCRVLCKGRHQEQNSRGQEPTQALFILGKAWNGDLHATKPGGGGLWHDGSS